MDQPTVAELQAKIKTLEDKQEFLIRSLGFYANVKNWYSRCFVADGKSNFIEVYAPGGEVASDQGYAARAALSIVSPE